MKKQIGSSLVAALMGLASLPAMGATPYVMSSGDYSQDFADIANWANDFASGVGAANWGSVAINGTGTIPDGQKTTVSTATFATSSTSGGVQRGGLSGSSNPAGTIVLLSTGSTDNTAACAIDLYLDFSGRTAGTLSFDWAAVANSTGNRASSLRVYATPDGLTWTELTGAAVLNLSNNVAASGSVTAVALPSSLDGLSSARIRFYECNGTGGSTGSRAKIAIDNVAVTSTPGSLVGPSITIAPTSRSVQPGTTTKFSVTASGSAPMYYYWLKNGNPLSNGGNISGALSNILTVSSITAGDAADYSVIVSNSVSSVTSAPPATLTLATSGVLVRWKFNGTFDTTAPEPSEGDAAATAALSGGITGFSQPNGSGNDFDSPNTAWGTASYPVNGASNKLAGPRFNVSTAGKKNITVSYDTRASTTPSRYTRLQFTTNGTDFLDAPTSFSLTTANIYDTRSYDLTGFPGVRNNPNFGVRIATEFESTATYGASTNANFVGVSSTYATSGTLSYDLVTVNADVIADSSLVPTVSSVADFSITDDSSATNINITIGDGDTAAAALTVTAVSSNTAVMFDPTTSGTTTTRTLQITPQSGQTGVVPILVKVTDPEGNAAVTWFYVTVTPGNPAPTISAISNTNTLVNTPISLPFTVNDVGTPVASLILSSNSENTALVANSGISITGTAPNYSVTVTPNTGSNGVAVIALTVTDGGGKSATSKFAVMVRPSTNVVFIDGFEYTPGPITTASVGLYATHSGTPLQMDVSGGLLNVTEADSEDVNSRLVGAPYLATDPVALYSSFVVNFSSLPTFGGGYFAHFKDDGTSNFRDRIYASTLDAAAGTYRIGTGNTTGTTNFTAQYPMDLQLGSNYVVVTRLVLSNGLSTVWINPTNELTGGVTDNTVVASPSDVTAFAFRQAAEIGTMTVDNLRVGTTFSAVTGIAPSVPTPVPLNVQVSGGNVILSWTDGTGLFKLATGTNVTAITNVVSTTSPYTNSLSDPQRYFRLVYP